MNYYDFLLSVKASKLFRSLLNKGLNKGTVQETQYHWTTKT